MAEIKEPQIRAEASMEPNPLGKLYHMSTTAGVGSQEYVAVNVISVIAILLGVMSSLALLGPELLTIPIVGLVFAVIALWQVSQSNGTQTGRLLAWGGIALAVMFAAMEGTRMAAEHKQDVLDQSDIAALVSQVSQGVMNNKMIQAYTLFGADFQNRVPLDRFKTQMQLMRDNPTFGKMISMKMTSDVIFQGAYDEDVRQAVGQMQILFQKHNPGNVEAIFQRRDGVWSIYNLPELFPPTQGR